MSGVAKIVSPMPANEITRIFISRLLASGAQRWARRPSNLKYPRLLLHYETLCLPEFDHRLGLVRKELLERPFHARAVQIPVVMGEDHPAFHRPRIEEFETGLGGFVDVRI